MNPIVRGVVAYKDVSFVKLAKEKWDYVVRTLQSGCDFELRLWKFDVLEIPEVREAAVNDAANAQVVFVATRGAGELPSEVKAWIEQWIARNNQKREAARLLALLFDPPAGQADASAFPQFAYLRQAARKGSMEFIVSGMPTHSRPAVVRLHSRAGSMRSWEDNRGPARDSRAKREALA